MLLSCNNNKNIETTKNESKPIKQTPKSPVKKEVLNLSETEEKLLGRYYVENLTFFSKQGFELTKVKPKIVLFTLYEFNFKKSGEIEFKDLTEFYDCGNGVLSFKNSKYLSKKDSEYNEYVIEFNGEYAGVEKFKVKAIYQLTKTEKGAFFLYLKKIIDDKRGPLDGD